MDTIDRRSRNPRRGAVLVIVLMVMLGLLGLGITALWLTSGNLAVGANVNQRTQALYAAEAGVEAARSILNADFRNRTPDLSPAEISTMLAGSNPPPGGADNVPGGLDAGGIPDGVGAIMRDQATAGNNLVNVPFPPGSFARAAGTIDNPLATQMGTYTVWVRNNTAMIRLGPPNYTTYTSGQALVVRSRGVAADNRTIVILEVSLGGTPGGPGSPGAPVAGPPVMCHGGKNSCDENNSVVAGVVFTN